MRFELSTRLGFFLVVLSLQDLHFCFHLTSGPAQCLMARFRCFPSLALLTTLLPLLDIHITNTTKTVMLILDMSITTTRLMVMYPSLLPFCWLGSSLVLSFMAFSARKTREELLTSPGRVTHPHESGCMLMSGSNSLNFAFMLVQGFYGYVSGSLGLLSDTVHMFFDCLALVVGLGAAVASKWPTSPDKPYGWGKLNTLAGFGNGIFLMWVVLSLGLLQFANICRRLVSVEFVWSAIESIMEGKELRRVQELLVVSTAGLAVNMVGLLAFGHAHAGHDHSHGHGHGHDHSHSHSHGRAHAHAHAHAHDHDHDHDHTHGINDSLHHAHGSHNNSHQHSHHGNENMHGIYLHIAADAGGSLAVILSTMLTLWQPWYLWDPLATILIAALIFAAAVPLVRDSGKKLLLVIPDELEYGLKDALQELHTLRGVVGYAVPRFWISEEGEADAHAHHHHGHSHGGDEPGQGQKIMGVIHIIAGRAADMEDVRARVLEFFAERNMEMVVQVEREGEVRCWCGNGVKVG